MNTHNICFCGEIRKISILYSSKKCLICTLSVLSVLAILTLIFEQAHYLMCLKITDEWQTVQLKWQSVWRKELFRSNLIGTYIVCSGSMSEYLEYIW